jgi:hypothetical protein
MELIIRRFLKAWKLLLTAHHLLKTGIICVWDKQEVVTSQKFVPT